jgi:hypothetical protein
LTTSPDLVTVLKWKRLYFGDEPRSRHHFEVKTTQFWRRDLFSSPFWSKKCPILATRPFLVAILRQETHNFSDET